MEGYICIIYSTVNRFGICSLCNQSIRQLKLVRSNLDTTLCYVIKFVNLWYSQCTSVSSTNKIDRQNITANLFDSGAMHHNPTTTTRLNIAAILHTRINQYLRHIFRREHFYFSGPQP